MSALYFDSGIDKGFEKDLKRMDKSYNSFSGGVEKQNKSIESSFNKLALTIGATFSAAQIVRFGKDSVNLYRDQQKALAQVEQGLKSTGNAAGLTFEELQKGASDLQKTTLFGDEDILQNATAQLLTFTNIADDQFTRTQKVALDLATRLDGDLKSSAIQLGKALNDPVANLSALSRSGIQFSEEQKKLIKTLAETGRLAEAQTVILDELETQYGGSAEAAAKADGGFTQLSNSIGDVQETLGGVITEGLQPFIKELQEFLNSLTEEEIRNFIENVKDGAQVIGVLITAIAAWKAGLLIMNQIQKINTALTALNTKARVQSARAGKQVHAANILMAGSMKKLKAAFAANPIGLLVTGLTLAIPLIRQFTDEVSETAAVQEALLDVNKRAEKSTAEQQVRLNQLLAIARDETASLEAREEALRQLNKISPEYLGNLSLATINTDEAKKATEAYTTELLKQARVQAASEKLIEIEKELIDVRRQSIKESTNIFERVNAVIAAGFTKEEAIKKIREESAKNIKEEEGKLIAVREELLKITTEQSNQEIVLAQNRGKSSVSNKVNKTALKNLKKFLSDQKKAYEDYNKAIDGLSDNRLKIVKKEYEGLIEQGDNYLDFLDKLLKEETDAKKRTVIKREIDITTLQNTILQQKAAEEAFDAQKRDLQELEKAYRTYTQKRVALEKEYTENISKLREAGYEDQALQAEKALQRELKALDETILQSNSKFQEWLKNELPNIAKEGVSALQRELASIEVKLQEEGLDEEQILVYKEQIQQINKLLNDKKLLENISNQNWKDSLELINGINTLAQDLIGNLSGVSESTLNIVTGFTSAVSGAINLATAMKAIGAATSTLEKASAVLAAISVAIKIATAVANSFKKAAEIRNEAYLNEIKSIQAINIELIKQNALYKEGNDIFTDDRWGTALQGLEAYNLALEAQDSLLLEIAGNTDAINIEGSFRKGDEQIRAARDSAAQLATELERALGSIVVKTRDRSTFGNFLGFSDEFQSLLEVYPDIIDATGSLDVAIAKNVISTANLSDAEKLRLENLVELTEQAEEVYAQFGNYISSIFGGVADDITKAFQVMYETGDDAMTSLEGSFSEMIEAFTRDAIEFAFLQPYLNELNESTKELGKQYAKGDITAEELQSSIINSLGDFYDTLGDLQPQILTAYENADRLAAAAGFETAFNPPEEPEPEPEPQDPLIDLIEGVAALGPEEVEVPEIEIPEIEIEEPPIIEIETIETPKPESVIIPKIESISVPEATKVSTPGAITQAITEETGTILAGRIGALVLANERILNANFDMLDMAMQNLVYQKQIKLNTDYLPEIAANTKKTYEKLETV